MSTPKVTAAQILRDALHHIRKGWMKEAELRVDGNKLNITTASPARARELKRAVEEGEKVQVCAIGGIALARACAGGVRARRVGHDQAYQKATNLLALAIKPSADLSEDDAEDLIIEFNDDNRTSQRKVENAFTKAITIAEAVGV